MRRFVRSKLSMRRVWRRIGAACSSSSTPTATRCCGAAPQDLLLHHTKLRRWLQPGGHADGDGNLAAVALREATEETGIDGLRVVVPAIDVDVHLVEPPREAPHHHYDVRYLVVTPPGATAGGNHESTDLRWATLADLDSLGCDPGVRRMAEAGLSALRDLRRSE
jgi:8-oxo-dGTP pyrophosphatase MutT (NUDIX family)